MLKDYFTTCNFWVVLFKPQQTGSVLFCCPVELQSDLAWVQQLISGRVNNTAHHRWQGKRRGHLFLAFNSTWQTKGNIFFLKISFQVTLILPFFVAVIKEIGGKYLSYYFQIAVYSCCEVIYTGTWESWSQHIQSQAQRERHASTLPPSYLS